MLGRGKGQMLEVGEKGLLEEGEKGLLEEGEKGRNACRCSWPCKLSSKQGLPSTPQATPSGVRTHMRWASGVRCHTWIAHMHRLAAC